MHLFPHSRSKGSTELKSLPFPSSVSSLSKLLASLRPIPVNSLLTPPPDSTFNFIGKSQAPQSAIKISHTNTGLSLVCEDSISKMEELIWGGRGKRSGPCFSEQGRGQMEGKGRVEPRLRVVEVESRETPAHGEACFTTVSAQEMMSLN